MMTVFKRNIVLLKRKLAREKDVRERISMEDELAYLEDFASGFDGDMPSMGHLPEVKYGKTKKYPGWGY